MRLIRTILLTAALALGLQLLAAAAESPAPAAASADQAAVGHDAAAEHGESGGLPPAAVPIIHLGPFVVSNSMIVTWVVALGLIFLAQMATRNPQLVPRGLQNFVEWLVGGLYEFFEGILGAHLAKKSFWFFATIFIFVMFTNWFGLLPGVGTFGWGSHPTGHLLLPTFHHVEEPLLRGGNADLNMTSAMALLFFFLWVVWSISALGIGGFLKHIFGDGKEGLFMGAILLFVGVLEVISIAFRPVSLSFRLYGNIFAGENILEAMATLVPSLGWLLPVPFYFLELLVGLVQALVFSLLTAVFTAMMIGDHGDHAHDAAHEKHH